MNVYSIISLIICLISLYFINYGSKMNNNQLVYGGFIAIIASIVAAIYFGCASSTDKRTNYPEWLENTASAVVPLGYANVWTSNATKSNKRPDYLGSGPSYNLSQTQKGLTAAWIESKVGSGTPNSFTSQDGNGITSIVVRNASGEDLDLPIMDFFEKIHGDIKLGFTRAQDYADAVVDAAKAELQGTIDAGLASSDATVAAAVETLRGELEDGLQTKYTLGSAVRMGVQLGGNYVWKGLSTDWLNNLKAEPNAVGEVGKQIKLVV